VETIESNMNAERKIYFLGNSQLIASVVAGFCPPAVRDRCGADWLEMRVSQGTFTAPNGTDIAFLACNMNSLGDPSYSDGSLTYSPALGNFLDLVGSGASTIFVMLRGNEFGIVSLVESKPGWDFSYGGREAVKGRQFVQLSDVTAYLDGVTNPLLASCVLIKHRFPGAAVVHVAAPPPVESESHILANPEIFGPLFEAHGVRPFAMRKKLYDAMYDGLAAKLQHFGIRSFMAPSECLTQAGGLKEEFAHGCLHGNDAYGRSLIGALQREFFDAPV
jgi:hypothetical protein